VNVPVPFIVGWNFHTAKPVYYDPMPLLRAPDRPRPEKKGRT
jgi:hypothetical protein